MELSTGQMVEDVRLALEGRRPVEFYGRVGGNVPTAEEVLEEIARSPIRPLARSLPQEVPCYV